MAIYFVCANNSKYDEAKNLLIGKHRFSEDKFPRRLRGPNRECVEFAGPRDFLRYKSIYVVEVYMPPIKAGKPIPRDKVPAAFMDLSDLLKPVEILDVECNRLSLSDLIFE